MPWRPMKSPSIGHGASLPIAMAATLERSYPWPEATGPVPSRFASVTGSGCCRFGAWREDFEKDRAAMGFSGPDLPVPRLIEIGEALGGFYAVSERHFGRFLEELGADGFRRIMPSLLRALDAMRRIPSGPERREVPWGRWLLDLLVASRVSHCDLRGPKWATLVCPAEGCRTAVVILDERNDAPREVVDVGELATA